MSKPARSYEAFPQAVYTTDGKTSATTTTRSTTTTTTPKTNTQPRRRRRSSGIPGDPIGDTETPAFATLDRPLLKELETQAQTSTVSTSLRSAFIRLSTIVTLGSEAHADTKEEKRRAFFDDGLDSPSAIPGSTHLSSVLPSSAPMPLILPPRTHYIMPSSYLIRFLVLPNTERVVTTLHSLPFIQSSSPSCASSLCSRPFAP